MLERAYFRFRENIPDNANTYAAAEGFALQGIPVVPFYGFGDLNLGSMPDLGPTAIVCGNIGDVWEALRLVGKPVPPLAPTPTRSRSASGLLVPLTASSSLSRLATQLGSDS